MNKTRPLTRSHACATPLVAVPVLVAAGLLSSASASAQTAPAAASAASAPAASASAPAAATTSAKARAAAAAAEAAKVNAGGTEGLQTVIVTGTVGAVQAKKTNASFSVLTVEELEKFTPLSADDYLRDMPGVFVESTDGVARNESFTRGQVLGLQAANGQPTSGNYWSTILEDGMPVLPVRASNFQDSNFYRADVGIGRVEGMRGGSTGTSVASSVGAVFNFMSPGTIRNGTKVVTRFGLGGDDMSLNWRQLDVGHGWRDDERGVGLGFSGFLRTSTHPGDNTYVTNQGGQIKVKAEKSYELADGSGGKVDITFKHLDDNNMWNVDSWQYMHGLQKQEMTPVMGRNANMFAKDSAHTVRTDAIYGPGSSIYQDPEKGANYRQDAVWIKWEHDTGGRWAFNGAVRGQRSSVLAQQSRPGQNVVSLSDRATWQSAYMTNNGQVSYQRNAAGSAISNTSYLASLESLNGSYELYDRFTGAVRARVRNNVAGVTTANLGTNYRTGAACATPSSTSTATATRAATPSLCVTMNNLPNANFQLRGGTVQVLDTISNTLQSVTVGDSASLDGVTLPTAALSLTGSDDLMLNFQSTYTGDKFRAVAGVYAVQSVQYMRPYATGTTAIAPFADGQVVPLGARFRADNGTTYQLTDEGGWGRGSQAGGFIIDGVERDISPMLGVSWSPGNWDLNASFKGTYYNARTRNTFLRPNQAGVTSLTAGGLDGLATTWYDNQYYVQSTDTQDNLRKDANAFMHNESVSVGYNFTPNHKVYGRYSSSVPNVNGIVLNRWTAQAQLDAANRALEASDVPQIMSEVAYIFGADLGRFGRVNGQITSFKTVMQEAGSANPTLADASSYWVFWNNRYSSRGTEAWLDWRILRNLRWKTALTSTRTKQLGVGTFQANSNTTADDDTLTFAQGLLQKVPKYLASNSVFYDVTNNISLNLRHRYMSKRKLTNSTTENVHLPAQRQFDLSLQTKFASGFRLNMEVRNLFNQAYIVNMSTALPTATTQAVDANGTPLRNAAGATYNVTANGNHYLEQLPDATVRVRMAPSRSVWLTASYEF